jgi:hypothetical protein
MSLAAIQETPLARQDGSHHPQGGLSRGCQARFEPGEVEVHPASAKQTLGSAHSIRLDLVGVAACGVCDGDVHSLRRVVG